MKAAKALKEKGETPEELLRSIKENEAAVAEAERVVDAWKAIVGEKARREEAAKAEAERIATEKTEAERKAAEERERAEAEEKTRIEAEKKEAERIAAEKAEEEARVEAERKAEEKTEEAESDKEEAEKQMDDEEPKPVGSGVFGNIYNQFKGKVKEAFDFLMKHKGGDLLGVFHRKDVGDIDLVWGDENGGLAHILHKHVGEGKSFANVDEAMSHIQNIIGTGKNDFEDGDKIVFRKGSELVTVRKNFREGGKKIADKNWVLTAYDKEAADNGNRVTTKVIEGKATPHTASIDKGSKKAEKKQKKQSVFDKAKEIADKEEKKRKAETEDDSALGQATRAVGKKKKVNRFKYTASEKISNLTLRGVHYANGYAYASDGYILFKEKADYPKEWEGTTRDKDGNLIDGKYPDAEKAIHRLVHIPDKEVESLPSKGVLDFAIAASKKLKGEAIPVAIDGIFFNAVNLKKFLEAVASKGMDKVVYRHPMLYATNGKDEIVMMPTVNTLEGALDIADRMESAGLPKEQIDAWKAHIEAADKKKSFDDFKKAVENAKKEGVRHTEAEQPLTEAERKDAEEVAGALGYRVEWVDTMEENGTIDADKKVIRIAKDAENPLVQVLGHEVAHGVRRMIGGKFRALQKAAMEVAGEKEWNERIEKKRKLNAYAEGKLAEEVTCDIVGEALNDKDALKRLAESLRGERGILARLRDAVVRMVEYFKNRGDKEGVRRMKAADKLLAELESALKEGVAPEQVKPEDVDRSVRESRSEKTDLTAEERELRDNLVERMRKGGLDVVTDSEEMQRVIDTENEWTRNMFVGEKGATEADKAEEVSTRLDNLSVARRMEEAEKDAKAIKMATGWERGTDGKWRYETSDIKPKPFEEWMNKKNLKLGDIIDSDSGLFEMYPELKDFKVTRGKGKSTNAAIYTGLGKIEINFSKFKPYMSIPSNREKINSILHRVINHEIQHAIQDSEGFAQGVSPNAFRPDAPIGKLREMEEADGRMVERYNAMPYTEKALGEGVRLKESILENRKEYNALASKYRFGMDGYTRAAGEVEARNTEKRIGMTEEGRRASLASETEDVAREDQILIGVDNADGEQRFLRTADGEVYGLVKDGRIYLDPKVATAETAVHEYTHLWGDMLRRKDSEQWSHTVKELKNSVLWEEVKELYPELKTDDEIADEVLSTFSGRRGAERLREEARRVADGDGGVFTKAKAIETLERVKDAIARFWEGVAKMFGINRYRSAEELADMALKDLLDSKNPMKDESGMRKRGEVGETLATSGTYFSGGGLLEAGLKGVIDPKVAVEFSEKIAGVYADNHGNHIVVADVRDVDPKKLVGAVDGGEVQYFHASPVCKNFSKAKREGGEVELDKETALSTAEFIAKTRPKVVTIENVKGYRNSEALKIITDELTRQGYDWDADVYNAADYGGYTKRERLIVRAKRDGKLPPKPEKLPEELRKKGWYSAVEDLIPHLEEKKTGVPQGTDERLKNSGIDYRTIDKPLYVFGRGYANKTVGHAFADELLPTLTTGGGDIIIMPDGRVLKASPRVLARVTGLPDTYKMPETDQLSHTIVGNGIPTQLTEGVIAPLLDNAIPSAERATKRESVFDVADRVSQNLEGGTRAMRSDEIDRKYPNWLDGTTTDSGRHSTQVEGTRRTYNKVGDWIEKNIGKDAKILDASSGLGYGTADLKKRGFNIEDVEPYQSEERKKNNPATYSSYDDIPKDYDVIISNAVLNVIPDNWRSDVLHNMADHLKPGGIMFINTRKAGEERSIKDKIELDSPQEVLVKRNGKIASYQRFFAPKELKEWVEKELGNGYEVETANDNNSGTKGLAAVVVKKSDADIDRSVREFSPMELSNEDKQRRGDALRKAEPIDVKIKQIVKTKDMSARKAAEKWWKDNVGTSRFYDTEIGLVEINRASVGSSLAHRYSQAKLDAITSLVDGFNNAVYLGSMQDFSRQEGVKNHYFAYPINYNGYRNYVFCRAMQDANKNRLYVHEVFLADNIEKGNTLQTAAFQPHGGITLYKDILANVLTANIGNNSEPSKPRFSRKPGESIFDYASRVSEDVDRSVRERVSARDEYEKKVKSKGFQTKEALQNSMLGLQEFMSAIDHASGNKRYIEDIPDFENPILGENRLSSVNKEESHSRLDAVHSPTPTKGVRKPYLRSYTMIYMPIPSNVSGS